MCCHSSGDCIGLPFSSLNRFPVIPTFGLPELTGWTECPSDLCPLSSHQQHPAGRHSVDRIKIKAMPRSILKFSKTKNTHDNTMDNIQMELSPVYNADSKMEYTIVLKGVEVVVSKYIAYVLHRPIYNYIILEYAYNYIILEYAEARTVQPAIASGEG